MKDKILELRKNGYSYNKIAEKLNCAKSTVSYYCSKLEDNDLLINQSIKNKSSFLLRIGEDKIELVIKLKKELKTYEQIRKITGLSNTVISKICREHNLFQVKKRTYVDSDIIEKINELYQKLSSIRKVSNELGISRDTVRKYIIDIKGRKSEIPKKVRSVKSVVNWRKRSKTKLVEYKGGKCEICGYNKCLEALEFHHLDPNEKDFNVSGKSWSFDKLKNEVDKCILVCSNCHKEIHSNTLKLNMVPSSKGQDATLSR